MATLSIAGLFPFNGSIERPKLNSSEPPQSVASKPCNAQYCMRATVKRFDLDGELISHYHGYSHEMTIPEETEKVCDRFKRKDETCSPASLKFFVYFLKQIDDCNGRIMETNQYDYNPKKVNP
jgi:hypothetical protein